MTEASEFETKVEQVVKGWGLKGPPIRINPPTLAMYESAFQGVDSPRVLVLGATPELIDLANSKSPSRVVSMEIIPVITEAMKRFASTDWSNVEFECGNWLSLNENHVSAFDFIFCDCGIIFNDFPDGWFKFFSVCKEYLAPGGKLITRMLDFSDDHGCTFEQFIQNRMEEFDENKDNLDSKKKEINYRGLATAVYVAAFTGIVDENGKIDEAAWPTRFQVAYDTLSSKYPQDELQPHVEVFRKPNPAHIPSYGPSYKVAKPQIQAAGLEPEFTPCAPEYLNFYLVSAKSNSD